MCVPSGLTTRLCGSSPLFRSSILTLPVPTSGRDSVSENSLAATETKLGSGGAVGGGSCGSRRRGRSQRIHQALRGRTRGRALNFARFARFSCLRDAAPAGMPRAATATRARSAKPARRIRPPVPGARRGRVRDDRRRVHLEPLLQQRAVDAAEVRGVAQVVVLVEEASPGKFADHLALRLRADQEAGAGRAVVGAGAVLLGPAPELAPHVHEHAVLRASAPRGRAGRRAGCRRSRAGRPAGCRAGSSGCRSRRPRSPRP